MFLNLVLPGKLELEVIVRVSCFSCVGNGHRWFFLGFAVLLVGSVVIFFFGCVSVGFCQSVWYRSGELFP